MMSATPFKFGSSYTTTASTGETSASLLTFGGTTGAFGFGATPTTSTPTSTVPTFSFGSTCLIT